ncbi:O-antigen polymerase [Spirosoma agri]|uniref:Oligosaccharide repeat unit polymerase n=1 Tax=Spirosoma agri TaxID=1987381 RepID=A0A6M0IKP9_9BACT|nr:O-antigen polymerase [Spirosoma agri]NEU68858.1 oligosaccharide repeat unit polymerase [Spirosoma agri]
MEVDYSILFVVIGSAAILLAIYAMLYRKFVYSVIDPLFVWIFTTSFASVLALQIIPSLQDIIHFFACQLSLWFGFKIAYSRHYNLNPNIERQNVHYKFSDQLILQWTTYFLLLVYISSNVIIGYNKGFALLSDAPTESKIANFQQGFGLFRKINWSTGTFVSTALIFMYFVNRKRINLIFLVIVAFFSSLEGSKSALLQFAISAGIVFYHPLFSDKQVFIKKFKRYIPLFFVATMSVFFAVLWKENSDLDSVFFAFIKRLLYSGDSILYYYQPVNISYFENYSFLNYISVLTNPILGFFRIQPYQEAVGNIMVDNLRAPGPMTPITVGPNAPFYIEGRIYFYYWGAFPFSFLVGYIYSLLRIHYFSLKSTSAFYFVYMGSFFHLASTMINDISLAITQSFDLAFFVIPPYIVVSFLLTRRLHLRLGSTSFKLYKLFKT